MRFCALLALAVATDAAMEASKTTATDSGAKTEGNGKQVLTLGSAFNFAYETAVLSKDMMVFTATRTVNRVLGLLPPDMSNTITSQYSDLCEKASALTLQIGLPSYEEVKIKSQLGAYWAYFKATELTSPVATAAEGVTKPAQEKLSTVFENFSQAYPDHSAKLPTSFWDRIFVLAILAYVGFFLLGLLKRVICLPCKLFGLCCGKRNGTAGKRAGRYSDKGKKNR